MSGTRLPTFDPSSVPLSSLTLIEASAGTGKTFNIAALYLRLVVESGLPVENILVVTYTVAATQELRNRIRARLTQARDMLEGIGADDPTCRAILARCPDSAECGRRLTDAIRGFDQAAIYTIHGFCQRVLGDRAFSSGVEFDTALVTDQADLLQQVVDDFWRREFYGRFDAVMPWLVRRAGGPESILADLAPIIGKPYLRTIEPEPVDRPEAVLAAYEASRDEAGRIWAREEASIRALVEENPALNKAQFGAAKVRGELSALADWLAAGELDGPPLKAAGTFKPAKLESGTKKGGKVPVHRFFDVMEDLISNHQRWQNTVELLYRHMLLRVLEWITRTLPERKRALRLQSFDDLLIRLRDALAADGGEALAAAVAHQYRAALIDEFQDTDPVQYEVFSRIYGGGTGPVFLVGDPKQAIYGFRGADVFAYLRARDDASQRYALDTNWRSSATLIDAVNSVFDRLDNPFVVPEIGFSPVAAATGEAAQLRVDGAHPAALRFWFLGLDENGKPRTVESAQTLAADATANEIVGLLDLGRAGRATLGDKPLEAGDIAVLVRSNRQARAVQAALAARGVISVQRGQDSVFESAEALELERVLAAVLEPSRSDFVAAALATVTLGYDGARIDALHDEEGAWDDLSDVFHELHLLWRDHGFMRMFRALLARFQVRPTLLRHSDGERRLTNLLHLAELLQNRTLVVRLGPERLLTWLAERRGSSIGGEDEPELRLENDAALVRIVTIHKSKGLEYPVTFCPFLWGGGLHHDKGLTLRYHAGGVSGRDTVDFRVTPDGAALAAAQCEEMAETLRLCYVALTRAESACYVIAAHTRQYSTSALAWLLHRQTATDTIADLTARLKEAPDALLLDDLNAVTGTTDGAIEVRPLPCEVPRRLAVDSVAPDTLSARRMPRAVRGGWRVSSFSTLVGGLSPDHPEHDPGESKATGGIVEGPIQTTFPRGAAAGTCLHAMFEDWDFHRPGTVERDRVVERTLARHGFASAPRAQVGAWLQQVVDTPLDRHGGLRLNVLGPHQRVSELEFHYPVAAEGLAGMAELLRRQGAGEYVVLGAGGPLLGFMKGFIDLVFEYQGRFYLADYKSNWLGSAVDDYRAEALEAEMERAGYRLQYLIYSVALCRYLKVRLPGFSHDRHFGGVYYLFIRGMRSDGGAGQGVFFDRPDAGVIEALDAYLGGRE